MIKSKVAADMEYEQYVLMQESQLPYLIIFPNCKAQGELNILDVLDWTSYLCKRGGGQLSVFLVMLGK